MRKPHDERARYSAAPGDPGHRNYWAELESGFFLEVRLDGRPLRHCITADEIAGVVHCFDAEPPHGVLVLRGVVAVERIAREGGK